jgi:hypothetical protein
MAALRAPSVAGISSGRSATPAWPALALSLWVVALPIACGGSGVTEHDAAGEVPPPTSADGGADTGDDGGPLNVRVTSDHCPIVYAAASPSSAPIGGMISLLATGVDLDRDGLAFLWSAPSGTLASPSAPATDYTCEQTGAQTLTITVSDGHCLADSTIPVVCGTAGP